MGESVHVVATTFLSQEVAVYEPGGEVF